jgi:hypothetical protein
MLRFYVVSGAKKDEISRALLKAHEEAEDITSVTAIISSAIPRVRSARRRPLSRGERSTG